MKKIFLFDIDGTLMTTSNNDLHIRLFKDVYNVKFPGEPGRFPGATDLEMLRKRLSMVKLSKDEIDRKLPEAIEYMGKHYIPKNPKLIEGADTIVQVLKEKNCTVGLLTGNIEPKAYIKLKAVGMDRYFEFGGFGSDAEERDEIVRAAVMKTTQKFGKEVEIFVIGDTPRDIEAAKGHDVKKVGVATGAYSPEQLKEAGADSKPFSN